MSAHLTRLIRLMFQARKQPGYPPFPSRPWLLAQRRLLALYEETVPRAMSDLTRTIDPRATARGVTIETPQMTPGKQFWFVKEIRWYDSEEANRLGPNHHIMIEVVDQLGKRIADLPFLVTWPGGQTTIHSEKKQGEPYNANFPMTPSRNEFSVTVLSDLPSEIVRGLGMGADTPTGFNPGIHTSTGIKIVSAYADGQTQPQPPTPPTDPAPDLNELRVALLQIQAIAAAALKRMETM